MEHIITFIGAPPTLSTDLARLSKALANTAIVAPAASKGNGGITPESIKKATSALEYHIAYTDGKEGWSRLSAWAYEPKHRNELEDLWKAFGKAAWIEFLPRRLENKIAETRLYIVNRFRSLEPLMHEVAHSVFARRKTSPLPLPLRNFRSPISEELDGFWYQAMDSRQLKEEIKRKSDRYRQRHARSNDYADDRSLVFSPAKDGECHGKAHPTGSGQCFVEGRFRFGVSLFKGFHYDVSKDSGLLDCRLYDFKGAARDMHPEKRRYVNIFPNDFILPI